MEHKSIQLPILIKRSIRSANINLALTYLKELVGEIETDDYDNEILMIEANFMDLEKRIITNTINDEESSIRKNKIRYNILRITDIMIELINPAIPATYRNLRSRLEELEFSLEKKTELGPSIKINYLKRSTKEKFEITINPHLTVKKIIKQLMLSFEPDFENQPLFKAGRIEIVLLKLHGNNFKRTTFPDIYSLHSHGIIEGDTIAIDFDISTFTDDDGFSTITAQ